MKQCYGCDVPCNECDPDTLQYKLNQLKAKAKDAQWGTVDRLIDRLVEEYDE